LREGLREILRIAQSSSSPRAALISSKRQANPELLEWPLLVRPEKESEIQRHIESREFVHFIQLCSGDVVNAKPTCSNQSQDSVEPDFTRITDG